MKVQTDMDLFCVQISALSRSDREVNIADKLEWWGVEHPVTLSTLTAAGHSLGPASGSA